MNNKYEHDIKDRYGNEYSVEISFNTNGMLPVDFVAFNRQIEYHVTLTSKDTGAITSYDQLLPSGTLFQRFNDLAFGLDLYCKADRMGAIAMGKYKPEINIDFGKHYEDMIVNMVNDFIEQFDELPIEVKKAMISDALDNGNHSVTNLISELFESTVDIKNFLSIDSTGELKKQMEQALYDAVNKGRINLTSLTSVKDKDDKDYDEYER